MGLFWYFFLEMFEHFRLFFLWVLQLHAFVYLIPFTIMFRSVFDSIVTSFGLLSLLTFCPSIFQPSEMPLINNISVLKEYKASMECTLYNFLVKSFAMYSKSFLAIGKKLSSRCFSLLLKEPMYLILQYYNFSLNL